VDIEYLHFSRRYDFLRFLIQGEIDDARLEDIGLLCSEVRDWEGLGRFCESHGIGPLASHNLSSIPEIPQKAQRVFRDITDRSQARCVILVHSLGKIIRELDAQGIDALVLKGPVFAETIYTNPVLRPFEDLDILINRKDMGRAVCVLKRIGFSEIISERERRFLKSGFHRKFGSPDGTVTELHWELLQPDFMAVASIAVWGQAQTRTLYGTTIKTLSRNDEFIYACAHLVKHLAACTLTKGIWISDLIRLLPAEISPELGGRIRKLRCRRMVFFAVSLLNRFLDIPPTEVEPWVYALGIDPITKRLIYKNASPSRVFSSPVTAASRIQRLVYRSLAADDAATILRFPAAYLKRHMAPAPKTDPTPMLKV
jgi:hypothetical protein